MIGAGIAENRWPVFFDRFNMVLKNKNQAVRQGARRSDKRSIFKHM